MKNKLLYFYNMYVATISERNNNYTFIYNGINYMLQVYDRPLDELPFLYELNKELINARIPTHQIIPTINKELSIIYNDKVYVLLRIKKLKNRLINIEDIISYYYVPNSKIVDKLSKSNWGLLWENKIDYFEYQFRQMNKKYPIISESINYYIGLWENAVSFYNNIDSNLLSNNSVSICHKRINIDDDLNNFYNPLNLVIDYKERDIAGYLKSMFFNGQIIDLNNILSKIPYTQVNASLLICRLLFPTYYFDMYERIINHGYDEKKLENIIKMTDEYEKFIKKIFVYYEKTNIIPINWIIKK